MPTFGDESTRGFFLRDGGYYFALSDYMDLALLGEIYTKGSWGLSAKSAYRKRYKFSGSFNASYLVTKLGDKGLPDYNLSKDFKVNWTHTQDPKANPYLSFSASVNFSTSSYDRNNQNSLYPNANGYADVNQNTKSSSINVTKRFPNNPFTISGTMSINQTTRDSSIAVTLPSMTVTMSRIFPFKRKHPVGKERWYEKISMSYSGTFSNSITTKENLLFKSNLIKDWQNAMQHSIPVSATFSVLKYLNISPSFNYKERWYTSKIEQEYDTQKQALVARDTTYGFYRIYDFNASISASTTLYGFYKPLPFLGNKVEMIRHRFEPSITVSAQPDFASSRFGFYETYVYQDANGEDREYTYSPFAHNMYGVPGTGKQGNISFDVNNNIEMKVRSDKDSTGFKKISLIDKLSLGMSYNMAADSFKWSDLSVGLRLKLSKSYTLNLNGHFSSINEVPGSIDLAVISLRADRILKALIDAGERGVAYALITPDENAYASDATWLTKLQLVADQYGMRLIGPDSLGLMNPGLGVNASYWPNLPRPGNIALITQSGMIGTALLDYAQGAELGFSGVVSTGAAIDVDMPELIDYYANDKNTRVIALHIEGIRRPREFYSSLRAACARKHVVILKAGSGSGYAADRIACFKMGTDAGSEGALAALVERAGATLVPTFEEFTAAVSGFATNRLPRGNRIAVIANGSGFASLTASAAQACGIDLHGLSNATIKDLKTAYPSQQIAVNPVNVGATASPERYRKTLQIVLQDPMIDGALVVVAPSPVTTIDPTLKLLAKTAAGSYKPVITAWVSDRIALSVRKQLRSVPNAPISAIQSPVAAALAFGYLAAEARRRADRLSIPPEWSVELNPAKLAEARAIVNGARLEPTMKPWIL